MRTGFPEIVAFVILVYVAVKLVSLIKYIHSIGAVRASVVFVLTFTVSVCYENLIAGPFTAKLVEAAAAK